MRKLSDLTDGGKEELAFALLLWKDAKADGKFDPRIYTQAIEFAEMLDVKVEFEKLMKEIPPIKVTLR